LSVDEIERARLHALQAQYTTLLKQTLTASIYPESAGRLLDGRVHGNALNPFRWLRRRAYAWLVAALQRKSIVLVRTQSYDEAERALGLDWPWIGYTMVGLRRLDNVQQCVEDVIARSVPGDLAETGVWRGGTSIFMRALLKMHGVEDRVVWAADSFEGMPKPRNDSDGLDLRHLDYLSVSLDEVKQNFARFGMLDEQVRFIPGWFSDSLPQAPIERLALLRLDGDLYSSTMDALQNLYHKITPGGYVIVDDYHSWEPCKRAVTDFLSDRRIAADIREIDGSGVYWQVGELDAG
jgi:O-methyltransferase